MTPSVAAPGSSWNSALIDQIADASILREAWYRVQSGGKTPGVDQMSVDAFRARADSRLDALHAALVTGGYEAAPLKRLAIPKAAGGWRLLAVPTVTDRVAQTAAAMVLHERVAALFSDRSFAYRPFLGPRRAAAYLRTLVPGAAWVVTADIASYFDSVDHRILTEHLRAIGIDVSGLRLILKWLTAPVQDNGRRFQPVKGLPQGSPIAPVLANIYLNGFDTALQAEGFVHVRYADDFVVLTGTETDARRGLQYVGAYLSSRLRLQIKQAKTQFSPVADGFSFVGFWFTQNEWTVPAKSLGRFTDTIRAALDVRAPTDLPVAARTHNDLVRGWRNYYRGNSGEMDRQLADLDTSRLEICRGALARLGQDPDAAAVWFEHLIEDPSCITPNGVYSHERTDAVEPPAPNGPDAWHLRPFELSATEQSMGGELLGRRELRDADVGARQRPVVFEDGWLHVPTFGAYITKAHGVLIVRRKKQTIFECSFEELVNIAIEARGVVMTSTVVEECALREIGVVFCKLSGRPFGRVVAPKSRLRPSVAHRQLISHQTRTGFELARAILVAKLANQHALLRYHGKYARRTEGVRETLMRAASRVQSFRVELERRDVAPMRTVRRDLFLLEARAAAHYWAGFGALVSPSMRFQGRVGRGATDIVNKVLNYGYALLLDRVWLAVNQVGLEPSIGLLHTGRRLTPGLVFDLMEPFRQPIVDRAVLALVGKGASLELNAREELTLRTRGLIQRAVHRRLRARVGTRACLSMAIRHDAAALRRSLVHRVPFRPYRMTW